MKIGILSDAHGNVFGIKRCLHYLTTVERVNILIFLGDAVGYMPDGSGVVTLLQRHEVHCTMGNHDAMLTGALAYKPELEDIYQLGKMASTMTADELTFLSGLPQKKECSMDHLRMLFVHGSPFEPLTQYIYPDTDLSAFKSLPYDFIFLGHSHRPFVRLEAGVSWINVGSCGLPRDQGNLASLCIFETTSQSVRIVRIPMPMEAMSKAYGADVHPSVIDCWRRQTGFVCGEIITGY